MSYFECAYLLTKLLTKAPFCIMLFCVICMFCLLVVLVRLSGLGRGSNPH